MDSNVFASKAFTDAINDYLSSKNVPEGVKYNSFFVIVIRILIQIYGELDIINPFQIKNLDTLNENLAKYGYPKENFPFFFATLDRYQNAETPEDFVLIQKMLVDMFVKKKMSIDVSNEEIAAVRGLIASPYASNPLIVSYNFLMAKDPMEIVNYFDTMVAQNNKPVIAKAKETLNLEAYEILKYSLEDIKNMSAEDLDAVNKKIYQHFNINENAINKKYLLDKAVFEYKNPKASYSGNGYVDILFFMGILATITMIIIVLTFVLA